jgi:hypothetical protein
MKRMSIACWRSHSSWPCDKNVGSKPAAIARSALTVVVLLLADQARAQTMFVQGGIVADMRRFSGQADDRVFDSNARTVMLGGGGFLTSIISAGVEVDLGTESSVAQSVTVNVAGRPEVITTTYGSRVRSIRALFGVHSPPRAIRVAAYAGLAFTALRQRIATDAPPIVLSTPPPPTEFTHLGATPVVGVDVAVTITTGVALVGMVRAHNLGLSGDPQGFTVRPGAALRVSF